MNGDRCHLCGEPVVWVQWPPGGPGVVLRHADVNTEHQHHARKETV